MDSTNWNIKELKKQHGAMSSKFETKEVVAKVVKRIDSFASIENIGYLQDTLMPKVKEACELMATHQREFTDMKHCIRQFDQSICLKVNKSQLTLLEEQHERKYIQLENWYNFMENFDKTRSGLHKE